MNPDGSRWILGTGGYESRYYSNRSILSSLLVSPRPLSQTPRNTQTFTIVLRLGNVGAVELGPLRMTTSEQVLGRITLVVEGNVIATSEVSTIRHDSNDTSSRYELDWPESVSLAVVSRSTSPVVFKFAGIETLQRRRVEAEGVLWLSAVGEVSSSFQIPLLLGTFDAFVFYSLEAAQRLTCRIADRIPVRRKYRYRLSLHRNILESLRHLTNRPDRNSPKRHSDSSNSPPASSVGCPNITVP